MKKLNLCCHIWTCRVRSADVLFVMLMAFSGMSFAAPPTGTSGGGNTTLSNLGCALGEVARVTDVEEWDCNSGLTTVEGQAANLDSRITSMESQNLDTRVSTIEGQNLDSRLSIVEGEANSIDGRVSTLEGQNLDARIMDAYNLGQATFDRLITLESQALNIRLSGLEADNAGDRLNALESKNLDYRVSGLEESSLQFNHVVTVSAVGPTSSDNGLELMAAIQHVANASPSPSAENPYLILVEPGLYDLGADEARLPAYTSMHGLDQNKTIIKSSNRVVLINNAELSSLTIESQKNMATSAAVSFSGNVSLKDVNVFGRWGLSGFSGVDDELRVYNSNFDVTFKCFDGSIINMVVDGVSCKGSTFLDAHGVNLLMKNSQTDGQINIFDGVDTSIVIKNSSVGFVTKNNVTPSPTQLISIEIANSVVDALVMHTTSDVKVKFSEIHTLNHPAGESFVTHSLIGVLNISGGISDIVNSQIGTLNDTGGSLTCPFSYDGAYSPLSGVSC